ncbi:MAG: hypothetical protein J0L75_13305 [Spirochaetes bacterium]|nr:hypothetical protein [Spirochaetota bacterium]
MTLFRTRLPAATLALAALLGTASRAQAQIVNPIAITQPTADKAGLFSTEVGMTARNLSMGRAFTGVLDDASALYFNPAGLALGTQFLGAASYSFMDLGVRYFSGAFAFPFTERFVLGVGWINTGLATKIDKIDVFGIPTGETFGQDENLVTVGLGIRLFQSDKWGLITTGINAKLATLAFDSDVSAGLGLDVGFAWDLPRIASRFGLSFQNVPPPKMTLATGRAASYPINMRLGYSTRLIPKLLLAAEFDLIGLAHPQPQFGAGVGAEWTPIRFLSLNAGWNLTELSLGTSLHLLSFDVGYAFILGSGGASHHLSLGYVFGRIPSLEERDQKKRDGDLAYRELDLAYREKIAKEDYRAASDLMSQLIQNRKAYTSTVEEALLLAQKELGMKIRSEELYAKADKEYKARQFDKAFETIQEVYRINPDYRKAVSLKEKIINHREVSERIAAIREHVAKRRYEEADSMIEYCLKLEAENPDLAALKKQVKPFVAESISRKILEEAALFVKIGNRPKALEKVEDALKYWPENPDAKALKTRIGAEELSARYARAFEAFKAGRHEDAIALCVELEATKAEGTESANILADIRKLKNLANSRLCIVKAKAALDASDFKAAETQIKKALEFDPTNPEALETYERYKSMKALLSP